MKFAKLTALLIIPILLLAAGCERKVVNEVVEMQESSAVACFECHGDHVTEILDAQLQYEESAHGTGDTYNENRNNDSYYASCEACHTHEGFVASVDDDFVHDNTDFGRINCFTCHAPHSNGDFGLRSEEAVTLEDGVTVYDKNSSNLCVACHHSRRDAVSYVEGTDELSTHFGPHHGPQSDMLLGVNAWEFDGYDFDDNSAHTNTTANGCLDCHMVDYLYGTGGHAFFMANEEFEYENTKGCNVETCHNGDIDEFDVDGKMTEIDDMMDELQGLLISADLLVWNDEDGAYEPPDGQPITSADSAGAVYNYIFVREDRSHGIHNFDYAEALLEATIEFMTPDVVLFKPVPLASH